MGRRRTISYRDTARLAISGGAISLVAALVWLGLPALSIEPTPWLGSVLGFGGGVVWFLGTAAGVLTLSTPYRRTGLVGLALCGAALVGFGVIAAGT